MMIISQDKIINIYKYNFEKNVHKKKFNKNELESLINIMIFFWVFI